MQNQIETYCRWSKEDRNASVKSLTDQLNILKNIPLPDGCVEGEVYLENKTASKPNNRPDYNRMIERIEKGLVHGVKVWSINRLARNPSEAGQLAQLLTDGKLQVIITPDTTYYSDDNILKILMEQGNAIQYSRDLRKVVSRGMDSARNNGRWTHRTPVGYLNVRDENNWKIGLVVRDEHRFELIKKGWQMLLTKAYSVPEVVDILNNTYGFRTRKTPLRGGEPLSYGHAYKIFSSPFYAGYTKISGQLRKGIHEAMVTEAEFNEVQAYISQSNRQRSISRDFTYKHLLRCANCGRAVTSEYHTMKDGRPYISYRCSDSKRQCTKKGISETKLEAEISRLLDSITVDPALCDIAVENIARWLSEQGSSTEELLAQQNQAMQDIEHQLNNLLGMWLKGMLKDEKVYHQKEAELQAERNNLVVGLEHTKTELERIRNQARNGFNYTKFAKAHFMVASPDRKMEIARALGISYLLRGQDKRVIVELDPLLVEIVNFTTEMRKVAENQFEPKENSSGRQFDMAIPELLSIGRPDASCLEHLLLWIDQIMQTYNQEDEKAT